MRRILIAATLLALAAPLHAQDKQPLDLNAVDPSMLEGFFGPWQIQNEDGSKTCDVTLSRDETIGGMVIGIADDCATAFPLMGEIAAWRLYDGFDIVLVDATRKERVRFYTPDAGYIATDNPDGIATIMQVSNEIGPAP